VLRLASPVVPTRVVILGAGFGGLELSTRLSEELTGEVDVTLIDQNDAFVFGFSKLDVMFGHLTAEEVRLPYSRIAKPGVTFRQERVQAIDPVAKRVVTDGGTYDADILVVALGADYDLAATPGLIEFGHEFYSPKGAANTRGVLADFAGGAAVIAVLGGFFKCPPAPYETAFMLHDFLIERGLRDVSSIHIVTTMPKPIPISDEVSDAILGYLDERGIEHSHGTWVTSIEDRQVHLNDGRTIPCDLLLAIPVHCAPPVVVESGLTDDGWIAVDKATLATKFPDVYAVGDVASAPVPRAGVVAEGEASTVAEILIQQIRGGPPPAPFVGELICLAEAGDGLVLKVNANFLSGPAPVARLTPPSEANADEKREFGVTRRRRWFDIQ
jgi:sulfide:quinone oxidoreductase